VAHNFKNWPDLTNIFRRAYARGVGVIAMKTLKGARHSQLADFTPTERESFPQAAFKWVLSNPDVSTVIPGMRKIRHVDNNIAASEAGALDQGFLAQLRQHRWDRTPTDWSQ